VLAGVVAVVVEMKTTEREWRPWNKGSSCAEIYR